MRCPTARIEVRPVHADYGCEEHLAELHTHDGGIEYVDCPNDAPAEPIALGLRYGDGTVDFDAIGSALCAACICASHGDGKPPR